MCYPLRKKSSNILTAGITYWFFLAIEAPPTAIGRVQTTIITSVTTKQFFR
jgi:hypothetical protein